MSEKFETKAAAALWAIAAEVFLLGFSWFCLLYLGFLKRIMLVSSVGGMSLLW